MHDEDHEQNRWTALVPPSDGAWRDQGAPGLAQLAAALIAEVTPVLTEVAQRLGPGAPDYALFLASHDEEVRLAATSAMQRLVQLASHGLPMEPDEAIGESEPAYLLFEEIGRAQWRQGRDVTDLLSAYQVGARVAWRHLSTVGLAHGADPEVMAGLAEALFVFVNQLSSASADGYVTEQNEAGAQRRHWRDELAELLLSDRSDTAAVQSAALRAGWPLPQLAAVVSVPGDIDEARALLARVDRSVLLVERPRLAAAIVPDPAGPGRRRLLAEALRGTGAVIGRAVPPDQLPTTLAPVQVAARLRDEGLLDDDPIFVEERLDAVIVHRDRDVLAALRERCLAPLAECTPTTRDRLTETLAAWLRHLGDRQAVAAELGVHPQTVRYRLGRLRELLGPALDDPQERLRLTLALAWEPVRRS